MLYPFIDPHTTCVYLNGPKYRDKEATHSYLGVEIDNTISVIDQLKC